MLAGTKRGIPLRTGRLFNERDGQGAPSVIIIDESLARREFPGENPIGKHLHFWDAPWFRDLPEVRALWPNRLAIAARLDGPYIFTETGTAGNGRLRHVDASITAVRASDESVQFFIVQAHDTTDQKHAERALRESEEQLRLAVEAAQLGFFDHDQRRDVLSWSPQMRSILGFSADEPVALPTYLDLVPADRRPLLAASIAKSHDPAGDGEFSAEHPVVLRDGRHLWISLRVHTIFEGEGAARKPVRTIGSLMDVTRRKANEHHQELLIAELDHRVKNTLARVSSVVVFTRQNSSSMPAFIASFEGRLQSMAQAHALLSRSHWKDVVLGELVRQQLAPYYKPGRVCIDGDEIRVSPDPAQALAMLLHELATNAVKYGSLSGEHGHVSVSWRKIGEPSLGQRLQLIWQEADGPPVHPPKRSGFGSVLIQDILSYEMDGKAELDFATTGLRCTIGIPLRELHRRDVMESALLGQPLPAQPRAASECRP